MARLKGKPGTVVKVVKSGNRFNAVDANGNKFTSYIGTGSRMKAYAAGTLSNVEKVKLVKSIGGKYQWTNLTLRQIFQWPTLM